MGSGLIKFRVPAKEPVAVVRDNLVLSSTTSRKQKDRGSVIDIDPAGSHR
jgi:hypothetical protein